MVVAVLAAKRALSSFSFGLERCLFSLHYVVIRVVSAFFDLICLLLIVSLVPIINEVVLFLNVLLLLLEQVLHLLVDLVQFGAQVGNFRFLNAHIVHQVFLEVFGNFVRALRFSLDHFIQLFR